MAAVGDDDWVPDAMATSSRSAARLPPRKVFVRYWRRPVSGSRPVKTRSSHDPALRCRMEPRIAHLLACPRWARLTDRWAIDGQSCAGPATQRQKIPSDLRFFGGGERIRTADFYVANV